MRSVLEITPPEHVLEAVTGAMAPYEPPQTVVVRLYCHI